MRIRDWIADGITAVLLVFGGVVLVAVAGNFGG